MDSVCFVLLGSLLVGIYAAQMGKVVAMREVVGHVQSRSVVLECLHAGIMDYVVRMEKAAVMMGRGHGIAQSQNVVQDL
jgi:hypothetical protein